MKRREMKNRGVEKSGGRRRQREETAGRKWKMKEENENKGREEINKM